MKASADTPGKFAEIESSDRPVQFTSGRRTFLGLSLQDAIRYFFGGNATVAIIILVLICGFLLHEGFGFFPEHHRELKRYRMAGLEYVALIDEEVRLHSQAMGQLRQAFYQEINADSVEQQAVVAAYGAVKRHVESKIESLSDRVESFEAQREDLEFQLDLKRSAVEAKRTAGEPVPPALAKDLAAGEQALSAVAERITQAGNLMINGIREAIDGLEPADVEDVPRISEGKWQTVVKGVGEALIEDEEPVFIAALEDVIEERQEAARLVHADFEKTINDLNAAIRPDKNQRGGGRRINGAGA